MVEKRSSRAKGVSHSFRLRRGLPRATTHGNDGKPLLRICHVSAHVCRALASPFAWQETSEEVGCCVTDLLKLTGKLAVVHVEGNLRDAVC